MLVLEKLVSQHKELKLFILSGMGVALILAIKSMITGARLLRMQDMSKRDSSSYIRKRDRVYAQLFQKTISSKGPPFGS